MPGPVVNVWFGDNFERTLAVCDMFLAVYAAGGGKRNMANFAKLPGSGELTPFRAADVYLFFAAVEQAAAAAAAVGTPVATQVATAGPLTGRLHICRYI